MKEGKPRFEDGKQGISHDRILMRIKDYLQIITTVGALIWGAMQLVRQFDKMNQQISMLQQQVSSMQQLLANRRR